MGVCRQMAVLLALLVLVGGCFGGSEPTVQSSGPARTPQSAETSDLVELEAEVMARMNVERQKRGLPALKPDERLTAAARAHSLDMAEKGFFDHAGSDGSQAGERISGRGYRWRFYAENIACGQRSADEVIASWMTSLGHRKNILSEKAEDIGVGVVRHEGTDCDFFWTAVFAAEQ